MKLTDCERVLKILKDKKPHRNFDIIEIFGGGFALAARINDLKNQGYNIKSGNYKSFDKQKKSSGDWYYQLQEGSPGLTREKLLQVKKVFDEQNESPFAFNVKGQGELGI